MTTHGKGSVIDGALIRESWFAVCRQRADFYAWFSTLFALEIPEVTIAAYQRGEATPLLLALRQIGLAAETSRLEASLKKWADLPYLRVELAADFSRLFLLGARDCAIPYASAYLDHGHQFYGEPHVHMQDFLRHSGLQVHKDFKEPSDHLAVYLASLEEWIRRDADIDFLEVARSALDQKSFIDEALLTWLPEFTARCQQVGGSTVSDFYPAVAALLYAYVQEDVAYLELAAETLLPVQQCEG